MDKEKFYAEDNEQSKQLISRESLITKFARAGFISLGVGILGTKAKNTKYKALNNDLVKVGLVASLSYALSSDDDLGGDIIATSAYLIGGAKAKAVREELLNNSEKMKKFATKMTTYDKRLNDFSSFSANFSDWFIENFKKNSGEIAKKSGELNKEKGVVSELISNMYIGSKAFFKTAYEPITIGRQNIKTNGFIDGSFKTLSDLSITSELLELQTKYTNKFEDIENIIPKLKMQGANLQSASVNLGEDGFFKSSTKTIFNKLGGMFLNNDNLFTINNENLKKSQEIKKVLKHLDTKNGTFFQDMVGMYTSYGESGTKIKYDKILKDKMHFGDILNDLAFKYQQVNKDALNHSKKASKMTPEQREADFIRYLKTGGFGDLIDNLYKKDGAITFGDLNEMVIGKNLATSDVNSIDSSLLKAIKMGYGEDLYDVNAKSYNENIINGFKNIDLIKNFAFTNVVKNVDGQILDETTLHGGLASLRVAGIIEKNIIAMYKNPFTNNKEIPISVWNPAKLIDANNRMKNILHNDIQKFGVSGNGYFSDGKMIQWVSDNYDETIKQANGKTKKINHKEYFFFSDNSRSYKMDFTRNTRDLLDQSFKVRKENVKTDYSAKDIYKIYKEFGAKTAFSELMSSDFNFTKLRYDGGGFRVAKTDESYFTEGTIFDFLGNSDFDYRKLTIDNRNIEKKAGQIGNIILGEAVVRTIGKNDMESMQKFFTEAFLSRASSRAKSFYERLTKNINYLNLGKSEDEIMDSLFQISEFNTSLEEAINILRKVSGNQEYIDKLKNNPLKLYENIINSIEETGVFENKIFKTILGENEITEFQKDIAQASLNILGVTNKRLETISNTNSKLLFQLTDVSSDKYQLASEHFSMINWYSRNYLNEFHKDNVFTKGIYEDFIAKSYIGDIKYKSYKSFTRTDFDEELASKISFLTEKDKNILGNYRSKQEDTLSVLKKIFPEKGYNELKEDLELNKTKYINYSKYDYSDYAKFKNLDEKTLSEFKEISHGLDFSLEIAEARRKNVKVITGILNSKSVVETPIANNTNYYISKFDYTNPDSVLNPIFEESLGYDYSNITKLYGDSYDNLGRKFINVYKSNPATDLIYGDIKNGVPLREYEKNVFNDIFGQNKSYRKLANKIFKDVILDGEEYGNYSYYDKFSYNRRKNYFTAVKDYEFDYFTKRDKALASSFIIQKTTDRFLEERTILGSLKQFINSLLYPDKSNIYKSMFFDKKSLKNSNLFGIKESNFGLAIKTSFNNLQNALEYIGIERVTSNKLGGTWQKQMINMMKYRIMPIAGVVTGTIALNSFTDAIVPDEVPIIGNGAFGVVTRGYSTARVGLQFGLKYSGALSVMRYINDKIPLFENGLTSWFDPLMDPKEMIDVYFKGKAIRINKNRFWFTAGRQTGEGEEFQEYRPHLLYQWGNPTSGIYSNKMEKFFRSDFLPTKYPWYILDPYKEEREMYENLGAVVPKTEQLFKDIPVVGHLLSMTIGEMIKPTQYIGEEQWRVGDNLMKNPNYNNNNPSSPQHMKFTEPNRLVQALFEGVEDLKTFSGLPGYTMGILTDLIFGASNPYENEVTLSTTDDYTSLYRSYEKMELGGLVGVTEPIRRLLDDNDALNMTHINPLKQDLPDWIPGYFKDGRNPYLTLSGGYYLQGDAFEKSYQNADDEEVNKLKVLSMIAPKSRDYKVLSKKVYDNFEKLSEKDKKSYYESISYAENYGKRLFNYNNEKADSIETQNLTIDKKLSPTEFMSDGKRYKIDNISSDFNDISKRVGGNKAKQGMNYINNLFVENDSYSFNISKNPVFSVGTDDKGDFIKVAYSKIPSYLQNKDSSYNKKSFGVLDFISNMTFRQVKNNPLPSHYEKAIGKRSPYQEWAFETVESPYFRDWDSPVTSFIEPIFNFSSNNLISALAFHKFSSEAFDNSGANINSLGLINLLGMAKLPYNMITGNMDKSSDYEEASIVSEELEKLKFLSNNKSVYNMTGKENLKQLSKMVNESDSEYLKEFLNISNESERKKILKVADNNLKTVLQSVWNRQSQYLNRNSTKPYDISLPPINNVTNIGAYDGNIDRARVIIKNKYNFSLSKLDNKRLGITKSYRGGMAQKQADYIKMKMYENYNTKPIVQSTIYPKGTMDIVKEE